MRATAMTDATPRNLSANSFFASKRTDTSSKIYLVGATAQTANPQTYSDNEVFVTNGVLTTKKAQVGGGACTLEYNSGTESLDFVFT